MSIPDREKIKAIIDNFGSELSMLAANYQLPITVLTAIVYQESGGDPSAIGDKNLTDRAYGLMQVRRPALEDVNKFLRANYTENDLLDARTNMTVGTAYLYLRFKKWNDLDKAVRTYNGGDGAVDSVKTKEYLQHIQAAADVAAELLR